MFFPQMWLTGFASVQYMVVWGVCYEVPLARYMPTEKPARFKHNCSQGLGGRAHSVCFFGANTMRWESHCPLYQSLWENVEWTQKQYSLHRHREPVFVWARHRRCHPLTQQLPKDSKPSTPPEFLFDMYKNVKVVSQAVTYLKSQLMCKCSLKSNIH